MSIGKRPNILRVKLPGGSRMYDTDADIRRIMRPLLFGIWQSIFDANPDNATQAKLQKLEQLCGEFHRSAYTEEPLEVSVEKLLKQMHQSDPMFVADFLERFFITIMAYHNGNIRLSQTDPEFSETEYASFAEQLGVLSALPKATQMMVKASLRKGGISRMLKTPPRWLDDSTLTKSTAKIVNTVRGGDIMPTEGEGTDEQSDRA